MQQQQQYQGDPLRSPTGYSSPGLGASKPPLLGYSNSRPYPNNRVVTGTRFNGGPGSGFNQSANSVNRSSSYSSGQSARVVDSSSGGYMRSSGVANGDSGSGFDKSSSSNFTHNARPDRFTNGPPTGFNFGKSSNTPNSFSQSYEFQFSARSGDVDHSSGSVNHNSGDIVNHSSGSVNHNTSNVNHSSSASGVNKESIKSSYSDRIGSAAIKSFDPPRATKGLTPPPPPPRTG